ncbi:MAG: hypothetical protein ACXVB0_15685 [Mucilaginibacter sp.]
MQVFKDLRIIDRDDDRSRLILFLNELKSQEVSEWPYLVKESRDYATHIFKDESEVAVFRSPLICHRTATVWLILTGREVKITNIVPTKTGSLSFDEYNAIFDRFYNQKVLPAARKAEVDMVSTAPEIHIEEVIGQETYEKLRIWEMTANPSSGIGHEEDFKRWADFLTTAFTYKSKINSQLLQRWLLEDRDWVDNDVVQNLGSEFEYGIDLLKFYVDNK